MRPIHARQTHLTYAVYLRRLCTPDLRRIYGIDTPYLYSVYVCSTRTLCKHAVYLRRICMPSIYTVYKYAVYLRRNYTT